MRKRLLMILVSVSFCLVGLIGCGGAKGVCTDLLNGFCKRASECVSSDTATQTEFDAKCRRQTNATATCENLTPSQEKEMEILSNTGCHTSLDTCTCGTLATGLLKCGSTCDQAIVQWTENSWSVRYTFLYSFSFFLTFSLFSNPFSKCLFFQKKICFIFYVL